MICCYMFRPREFIISLDLEKFKVIYKLNLQDTSYKLLLAAENICFVISYIFF
jgi:hypothetical protein